MVGPLLTMIAVSHECDANVTVRSGSGRDLNRVRLSARFL